MLILEQNSTLLNHIVEHAHPTKAHGFLNPPPSPQQQRGECCKLYAIHTVMQWLHETGDLHQPPQVRRNTSRFSSNTLRHQAKTVFNSQVGEMYNINELCELAKMNGYDGSSILTAQGEKYIQSIISALHNGNAPVVFFDIDFDTNGPGMSKSEHEHAAVIFGYYSDSNDKIWFIATCWNGYYVYSADELQKSAAQLAQVRAPETFYKVKGTWLSSQGRHFISDSNKQRQGKTAEGRDATFCNKILTIETSRLQLADRRAFCKSINELVLPQSYSKTLRPALPKASEIEEIPPPNFIPLSKLITYLTLNAIKPASERNTLEKWQNIIKYGQLTQEVDIFLQHKYTPPLDFSVESDIYLYRMRSRSIIEEVSNSIDACPEKIECIIQPGYYEVREVNGLGMNAFRLFSTYLLPKESDKTNSEKQIGRFGIGSFAKLAHLNTASASVVVETRALNSPGYRLEFRLVNGEIYINVSTSEEISYGTLTQVFSSEIGEEYEAALKEYLADLDVSITINNQLVKPPEPKNYGTVNKVFNMI